jgi:hypothetical protein
MKLQQTAINRRRPGGKFTRAAALCLLALAAVALRSEEARAQWTAPDAAGNISNTNTGNVGIGTPSPDFTGWGPSRRVVTIRGFGERGVLELASPSTGTNGVASSIVGLNGTSRLAQIDITADGAPDSGSMEFYTWSAGAYGQRMRITGLGNVGIGTGTPGERLTVSEGNVYAGGAAMWTTGSVRVTNTSAPGGWRLAACSAAGDINCPSGGVTIHQDGVATRMAFTPGGNVGIGTNSPASKLHVVGDVTVTGNINAKWQDVAEWVPSVQKLQAGTVVVLDTRNSNHVLASTTSYDARVAGVVSAQPGLTLGEAGEGKALVATTGRVKVKVDATRAPIQIGDLLVTGDAEGVAMKSEPINIAGRQIHAPGTIIGKALEPLAKGTGEILVLLSLQ